MSALDTRNLARAAKAKDMNRYRFSIDRLERTILSHAECGMPGGSILAEQLSYESIRWAAKEGYELKRIRDRVFIAWDTHGMEWAIKESGYKLLEK